MDYVPAAMLWLLTIVRLPTAFSKDRAPVLRATFFAAIACSLFAPAIYTSIDPLLGGRNHVGLVLILAILAGFWQFHTATVMAAFSDDARRRHHLVRGRLAAAFAGSCVVGGFAISHVDVTTPNLPVTYGDQPGMQLFLWAGSAFIIGVCASVAYTCLRLLPQMNCRSFRSGVACFTTGCVFMALALGNRLALGLLDNSPAPANSIIEDLNWSFPALETLAVLLVSIGLVLPRFRDTRRRLRQEFRSRWYLVQLTPLWRRSSHERKYLLRNRWTPFLDPIMTRATAHLHRRVVEIRDCQLRGLRLRPRDRVLVNRAEQLLQGH